MSETNNNDIPQGGSIAFFATYRPPIPLDIYSSPILPTSPQDEHIMTDGHSYNYNGQPIPPAALKLILKRLRKTPPPSLAAVDTQKLAAVNDPEIDSGRVSGLVLVSERTQNLETLHFAILDDGKAIGVINFAELYGVSCGTVRMEDSGCIAGDNLIYVTTKEPDPRRRQPWTAVFRTNLKTGLTQRLTPKGEADLSPAVSPSGKLIAMASYQFKCGWKGEIEDLKTDIFVMNVDRPHGRFRAVADGGWPSWADDNTLFFHRRDKNEKWGVYRADITKSKSIREPVKPETQDIVRRVTPEDVDAVTPVAVDATTVAVAIIRSRDTAFSEVRKEEQYRHIEIFDVDGKKGPIEITRKIKAKADHYNPFLIVDKNGVKRIGYHRCRGEQKLDAIQKQSNKLPSPYPEVGLFRVPGVFPTFSNDGTKLAFVDNEFRNVYIADKKGLRKIYEAQGRDGVFNPVWNQNPKMDKLYVCVGPSFHPTDEVNICVLSDVSKATKPIRQVDWLTDNGRNNAFPSTNPEGTKLVFRSTKDFGKDEKFKNLYIMQDADTGEYGDEEITRLTNGKWTDTHCQWSPNGGWIVFTSTRDKPGGPESQTTNDDVAGLDLGSYAVYLVKPTDPSVVIRVVYSGSDVNGHVTHPFFNPDGKYIVLTSDLAGISADPISMPLFLHSVRPYGDIFCVKLKDEDDITKNKDIMEFTRITHSRFESAIAAWTKFSTQDSEAGWNVILDQPYMPICPVFYTQGGEKWNMTGHLCIPRRCC